jgi:hypothetical protein
VKKTDLSSSYSWRSRFSRPPARSPSFFTKKPGTCRTNRAQRRNVLLTPRRPIKLEFKSGRLPAPDGRRSYGGSKTVSGNPDLVGALRRSRQDELTLLVRQSRNILQGDRTPHEVDARLGHRPAARITNRSRNGGRDRQSSTARLPYSARLRPSRRPCCCRPP